MRRGQARGRRSRLGEPRARDHRRRHSRDGACRADPAELDRARRLEGPGPHRRRGGAHRLGGVGATGQRLLCDRVRGDPERRHQGADAPPRGARDRHRRRARHRWPGARLPRPARHPRRAWATLRQALRQHPTGDGRGRQRLRRGRAHRPLSRGRSTATRSTPASWRSFTRCWRNQFAGSSARALRQRSRMAPRLW